MDYVLVDLLAVPKLVIWAWLCVKVLPMRHGSLFIACSLAPVIYSTLLTVFVGVEITPALGGLYYVLLMGMLLTSFVMLLVLPCLWYEGRRAVGLVLSIVVFLCLNISDVVACAIFTSMVGPYPESNSELYRIEVSHFKELIISGLLGIFVMVLLFLALHIFLSRHIIESSSKQKTMLLFLVTQGALILLTWITSAMFDTEASFYLGLVLLCVSCLVVDSFLFITMEREGKRQLEDQRAEMLQEQLAASLVLYGSVVQEVESMARFRHDFRNQTHVVFQLLKQGHRSQAQECVDALRERL